jgi:hypothetical protein
MKMINIAPLKQNTILTYADKLRETTKQTIAKIISNA